MVIIALAICDACAAAGGSRLPRDGERGTGGDSLLSAHGSRRTAGGWRLTARRERLGRRLPATEAESLFAPYTNGGGGYRPVLFANTANLAQTTVVESRFYVTPCIQRRLYRRAACFTCVWYTGFKTRQARQIPCIPMGTSAHTSLRECVVTQCALPFSKAPLPVPPNRCDGAISPISLREARYGRRHSGFFAKRYKCTSGETRTPKYTCAPTTAPLHISRPGGYSLRLGAPADGIARMAGRGVWLLAPRLTVWRLRMFVCAMIRLSGD